jgi:hypothetical protein
MMNWARRKPLPFEIKIQQVPHPDMYYGKDGTAEGWISSLKRLNKVSLFNLTAIFEKPSF